MIYPWFTAVPVIVCGIAYVFFHQRITLTELTIQVVVTLLIGLLCGVVVYHQNIDDLETWNGITTGKDTRRVSCEHSYPCNPHPCMCSTSKSGFRSCSTCWDTCYRHFYDVDWRILTSLGPIKVHRVDDQGLQTPRRWEVAVPRSLRKTRT